MNQKRVCFSTPQALPLFDASACGDFGGAELRSATFAKQLTRFQELEIVFHVLADRPDTRPASIDGIRMCYQKSRMPMILARGRWARWRQRPAIWTRNLVRSCSKRLQAWEPESDGARRILDEVHADVYCCFGIHTHSALVAEVARRQQARFVLFLASDTDCSDTSADVPKQTRQGATRRLREEVLGQADLVVTQTTYQANRLREHYGIESITIANPLELPAAQSHPPRRTTSALPRRVLWMGRADTYSKRADLAVEIAEQCQEIPFRFVMNRRDRRTFRMLEKRCPTNVELWPYVPFPQSWSLFSAAPAFINTSVSEGFPNAFLQAAASAVPIYSLNVDPGQMLSRHGCGTCFHGDIAAMSFALRQWYQAIELRLGKDASSMWCDMAVRGPRYVREFHEPRTAAVTLVNALNRMDSLSGRPTQTEDSLSHGPRLGGSAA